MREDRVLVTGAAGQLGSDVVTELEKRGIACQGADIADFDLTDADAAQRYIRAYAPVGIVHCAAYTAVDRAESEKDAAYAVNVLGTRNIARAAAEMDAKLMYISTDYVFGGSKEGEYDAHDAKDPRGVYARTKYEGELECKKCTDKLFIVRLSWVFGLNGNNFVKTMLRLADQRDELAVVCDQVGSPTYTPDAARLICDMMATEKYGEYNVSNEGACSWHEFACEIMRRAGKSIKVNAISSAEYAAAAERPANSCFSKKELREAGFALLPPWQDALERFLRQYLQH